MNNISDWTNLPPGADVTSLWVSLHDGSLVGAESDRQERSITLKFEVLYLCEFHKLTEDTQFLIQFHCVQSARVTAAPREGFEVSLSWDDFAANMSCSDALQLEVMQADLAVSPTEGVTLQLLGFSGLHQKFWMTVSIRAEWMKVSRSDGVDLTIEQFLRLGGEYWDDFGKRHGA